MKKSFTDMISRIMDHEPFKSSARNISIMFCTVSTAMIIGDRPMAKVRTLEGNLVGGTIRNEDGETEDGAWLYFIDTIDDLLLKYGRIQIGDSCLLFYPSGKPESGVLLRSQDFGNEIDVDLVDFPAIGPVKLFGTLA